MNGGTFTPGRVYENLTKMMAYRGAELSSPKLDQSALAARLNGYGMVTITGRRPASDRRGEATLAFVLVAPGSDIAGKSATFMKLLKDLPPVPPTGILEVVIVSEEALTTHIEKKINAHLAENPRTEIESHTYKYWLTEAPLSAQIPKHSLPADGEVERYCREHFKMPSQFPIIRQRECMATWLGLKLKMVVRVDRISETAGEAVVYRYCVPGR